MEWLRECERCLKPNGVLYFWHNNMPAIAEIMENLRTDTGLVFQSFCIWDKGSGYHARSWKQRDPNGKTAPRSWFNVAEYCLHYFKAPREAGAAWRSTGLDRIHSNPECFKPLKEWYAGELKRLNLTRADIAEKYTAVTGRKPYMLRHYFQDSQFGIPTKAIWESVYMPLGFGKDYEALRMDYEALRNTHNSDAEHCNIWHRPEMRAHEKRHICQKPQDILRRLIRVSSNPGEVVLDCFMGSGATGIACIAERRDFIGIEKDEKSFLGASEWIERESAQLRISV
jgi:DNA modification methylase